MMPTKLFALLTLILLSGNTLALDETTIAMHISQGHYDKARTTYNATSNNPNDRLFYLALVQKSLGLYDLAIEQLQLLLAREPHRINAKRELAHSLLLAQDYQHARAEYVNLLSAQPDALIGNEATKHLAIIDSIRPFDLSGGIAISTHTNLNNGAETASFIHNNSTYIVGEHNQAISGLAIDIYTSAFYRHTLTPRTRLGIYGNLATRINNQSLPATNNAQLQIIYDQFDQPKHMSAGLQLTHINNDTRSYGLSLSQTHTLQNNKHIKLSAEVAHYNHRQARLNSGDMITTAFAYHTQLDHIPLNLSAKAGKYEARADFNTYHHLQLSANTQLQQTWPYQIGLNLTIGENSYQHPLPLLGTKRLDHFGHVNISISKRNWLLFSTTPSLTCSYQDNRSNIQLYDREIKQCRITFSRTFN